MKKKKASKPPTISKGQVEAEISNTIVAFEKEYMGRGPEDVRTHIIQDMVLIRLKGVLTPAERHLAKDEKGIQLIKQVRAKLLEASHKILDDLVKDKTGCGILSFHTDISTKTGERFIIITLSEDLERQFSFSK